MLLLSILYCKDSLDNFHTFYFYACQFTKYSERIVDKQYIILYVERKFHIIYSYGAFV